MRFARNQTISCWIIVCILAVVHLTSSIGGEIIPIEPNSYHVVDHDHSQQPSEVLCHLSCAFCTSALPSNVNANIDERCANTHLIRNTSTSNFQIRDRLFRPPRITA